ncbi:MAG: hypothetical protein QM770_02795 [Tepidisphaeraceae bacterium]
MKRRLTLVVHVGLLAVMALAMTFAGYRLRERAWIDTIPIRFRPDMENAWRWGSIAAKDGYVGLYSKVVVPDRRERNALDYMPLRLGVMTLWAKSRMANGAKAWTDDYAFNRPLLQFNTLMEWLTAAGLFALTFDWMRRDARRRGRPPGWVLAAWFGLIAAGLAWFNPASLISAHGRPTWDVWVTPFFVWAVFCCTRNAWMTAGALLATGALFKGQELIVVPFFVVWAITQCRVTPILRWALGFMVMAGVLVSPWIVGASTGRIACVIGAALLVPAVVGVIAWRRKAFSKRMRWVAGFGAIVGLTLALWTSAALKPGAMDWYTVGIAGGIAKFDGLQVGGASSLAGILEVDYGYGVKSPVGFATIGSYTPTLERFMSGMVILAMIAAGIAATVYGRRGDARFLAAIALPWIAFFALGPRMHERYLLWGALASLAAAVALRREYLLMAIFLTIAQTVMSLMQTLSWYGAKAFLADYSPTLGRQIFRIVPPTFPAMGWAIVTVALVWLCCALWDVPKLAWEETLAAARSWKIKRQSVRKPVAESRDVERV